MKIVDKTLVILLDTLMEWCDQEMHYICKYGKALDFFKYEFLLLQYLISPPEDFDTIVPAAQVEKVDGKDKDYISISTCTNHCTVNESGVEDVVESWFTLLWISIGVIICSIFTREIQPCRPW